MKKLFNDVKTKAQQFTDNVTRGSAGYQWANNPQHHGALVHALDVLEACMDDNDREVMLQKWDVLKSRHTTLRLTTLLTTFCGKEAKGQALEDQLGKLMQHHLIENKPSGKA